MESGNTSGANRVASRWVDDDLPIAVSTPETVAKTEACLNGAGKDAPAALRRFVNEAKEGLERALRAQDKDK